MCGRKLNALLSLSFICAASSYGKGHSDGSFDVGSILKNDNSTESILYQVKNCVSDLDCHFLGKCETRDDGTFCDCNDGTSGDFCETVNNCTDGLEMCGASDEVSCVFDVKLGKAVCKCDNETKTYVSHEKRCMRPCTSSNQCGMNSYCLNKVGNEMFCICGNGMIGDYCEIIELCHTKKIDCGVDRNATCTLGTGAGRSESAYCQCENSTLEFDYDEKVCKDCAGCGIHAYERCMYKGGKRICFCNTHYYSSEEGKCEDCKCGYNNFGCSFKNGTKVCECDIEFSQNGDVCERCDCGIRESECKFVDSKRVCTCKLGYAPYGKGGKCRECECFPGSSCTFGDDFVKKCICPKDYADDGGKCGVCDCRVEGANCSLASAVNTCQCPHGYEQVPDALNVLKSYCHDIDECKQPYICPPTANCVNTIGSYDCVCNDGYEKYDLNDTKKDGCRDIDECLNYSNKCGYIYLASCVNTPGSYRCICPEGYNLPQADDTEKDSCISENRPWRTVGIVVGVLLGVAIAALLLVVIVRKHRSISSATSTVPVMTSLSEIQSVGTKSV